MPVVELDYGRLRRLVGGGGGGKGRGPTKRDVEGALPYLGLDIEGGDGGAVRVEYSPNRPDYSTDWGVAAGLRGLLGIEEEPGGGAAEVVVGKGRDGMRLRADPSVAAVRPFIAAVAARGGGGLPGGRLGGRPLAQLIAMQEDLHDGIGRRRRKASIGLHDMGPVRFPLSYTTAERRGHRFVPLGGGEEMTAGDVLARMPVGAEYGGLLAGHERVPVLLGADGTTLSLPPVINGAATALSESTADVLVEVTGTDRTACEDALSVAAHTLRLAGFAIERVLVSGAGNRTPGLGPRRMSVDARLVARSLGVEMTAEQVAGALRRAGIRAEHRGRSQLVQCTVPRHRFDILGPMDLVEEAMLGYGVQRIEPALPPSPSAGSLHPASASARAVRLAMVGLGYTEALSPILSDAALLRGRVGRGGASAGENGMQPPPAAVLDPKSADRTALRDSLLPGLLDALSRNVHEPYPQRLFEVGTVFAAAGGGGGRGAPPSESRRLCAVCAHSAASYTEIKGVLLAVSGAALGGPCSTRAAGGEEAVAPLAAGRSAAVYAGRSRSPVGIVGELGAAAAAEFRMRQPVAALEVELPINTARRPGRRPKSRRADGPG